MRSTLPAPGLLGRLARFVQRKDKYLVGRDLEGNRYFESPPEQPGAVRPRRVMEYENVERHASDITARAGKIPVQWASWLAFTRAAPPTLEELEADRSRRTILAERVARLEAKDAEERLRQLAKLEAERQGPAQQRLAAAGPSFTSTAAQQTIGQPLAASTSSSSSSGGGGGSDRPDETTTRPAASTTPTTGRPSRPDPQAPTPPSDPLRAASQRALREQVVNSGTSRAERQGKTAEGLPRRQGGEEWKPQGWSGKVAVRRGE